jgi:DNA-binding transcriptional LysR family regulator
VRIAVSPIMADHFLIPRVPELRRRFPEIRLDVFADITHVNVLRREADIAIRQRPRDKAPAEASALVTKVGSFAFAAYASPAYIERHGGPQYGADDLEGHEMISTGKWSPGDPWNDQLAHPAKYVLSVYPFAAANAAALAGIGIAVLPCLGTDTDSRLVRLTDVIFAYETWVVTSQGAQNNPRVKKVKDALVEMLREAEPELSGVRS